MFINRFFSERLKEFIKQYPVIVLTGARQTGKTTLLRKIFHNYNYISLDLPSVAEQAEKNPETFFQKNPPPLVIDEVQYAPTVFRHIKYLVDSDRTNGHFILTGSQKFTLIHKLTESLAGRCVWLELENLAMEEIRNKLNPTLSTTWIQKIITRGQFPELWKQPGMTTTDFYASYLATYLERDVRQILNVHNLRDFERFIRILATRSGQLLNKAEIAKEAGISTRAANDWLSVLEASNQIVLLEPWYRNFSKRIVKSPKLYFCDSGLLCFLLDVTEKGLLNSPFLGHLWETFVYAEIRKLNRIRKNPVSIWYYRDQRAREIDFLLSQDGRLSFIECKWTTQPGLKDTRTIQTISAELTASSSPVKPGGHKVLCMTSNFYSITPEIDAIGPRDFEKVFDILKKNVSD